MTIAFKILLGNCTKLCNKTKTKHLSSGTKMIFPIWFYNTWFNCLEFFNNNSFQTSLELSQQCSLATIKTAWLQVLIVQPFNATWIILVSCFNYSSLQTTNRNFLLTEESFNGLFMLHCFHSDWMFSPISLMRWSEVSSLPACS